LGRAENTSSDNSRMPEGKSLATLSRVGMQLRGGELEVTRGTKRAGPHFVGDALCEDVARRRTATKSWTRCSKARWQKASKHRGLDRGADTINATRTWRPGEERRSTWRNCCEIKDRSSRQGRNPQDISAECLRHSIAVARERLRWAWEMTIGKRFGPLAVRERTAEQARDTLAPV